MMIEFLKANIVMDIVVVGLVAIYFLGRWAVRRHF